MTFCDLACSDASGGRAYKVRPDHTAQPYLEPSLPCQRAWIPVFRFFLFFLHSLDHHSKWQNQPLNSKTKLIIVSTLKSFLNTAEGRNCTDLPRRWGGDGPSQAQDSVDPSATQGRYEGCLPSLPGTLTMSPSSKTSWRLRVPLFSYHFLPYSFSYRKTG